MLVIKQNWSKYTCTWNGGYDDQPHVPWRVRKVLQESDEDPNICLIPLPPRNYSVADRLFSEYDNEVELESDNANQNQNSTTSSFFCSIWSRIHATVPKPNRKWTLPSV